MKTIEPFQTGLAVLFVMTLGATAQNIVTNGDFEQVQIQNGNSSNPADIPGWVHLGDIGDALLWRVGYSDVAGSVTVAGEGLQFVTLGGGYLHFGAGGWSQVLNGLTSGATYQLTFKMASEADFSGPQSLTVQFPSGSPTGAQTFSAATPPVNYWSAWEIKTMNFVATNTQVMLLFTNSEALTEFDVGLDSVGVTIAPPQISFLTPFTNGQFRLRVTGAPGTNYTVQVATNLDSSGTSWISLFTSNSVTGTFDFTDWEATTPLRYYRAVSQ